MVACALVVASVAGGACATSRPASLAGRFIVPGEPAVDLSAPAGLRGAVAPPSPAPEPVTVAAPPRPAATVVTATTLESTSPLLRTRLAALAASPTPEAHLDVADAYARYRVHDRAYDHLAAGLVRYPHHVGLHDAVARLWRDWGLPERALRHAHLAVRYGPDSAAAHTTLGSVLWALASRDEAAQQFARAFALAPSAAYTRRNWCTAVEALGRPRPFACDVPYAVATSPAEPPR